MNLLDENIGLDPVTECDEFLWERSNGKKIRVGDMVKFHLIQAAKKLKRQNLEETTIYEAITAKLWKLNNPDV